MSERAETELTHLRVPDDTAGFIAQGRPDDSFHPSAGTERACCCPSRPAVRVRVPMGGPDLGADLLLCSHHYRRSRAVLSGLRATVSYIGNGPS